MHEMLGSKTLGSSKKHAANLSQMKKYGYSHGSPALGGGESRYERTRNSNEKLKQQFGTSSMGQSMAKGQANSSRKTIGGGIPPTPPRSRKDMANEYSKVN